MISYTLWGCDISTISIFTLVVVFLPLLKYSCLSLCSMLLTWFLFWVKLFQSLIDLVFFAVDFQTNAPTTVITTTKVSTTTVKPATNAPTTPPKVITTTVKPTTIAPTTPAKNCTSRHSCSECTKSNKCFWCGSSDLCVKYPKGKLIPTGCSKNNWFWKQCVIPGKKFVSV